MNKINLRLIQLIVDRVMTSDLSVEGRQTRDLAVKCVIICVETDHIVRHFSVIPYEQRSVSFFERLSCFLRAVT